jgi:hypothetical protein
MLIPLQRLKTLIDLSPHTPSSASRAAGLYHGTIGRWLAGEREPKADELDRALRVFGYTLTAERMKDD